MADVENTNTWEWLTWLETVDQSEREDLAEKLSKYDITTIDGNMLFTKELAIAQIRGVLSTTVARDMIEWSKTLAAQAHAKAALAGIGDVTTPTQRVNSLVDSMKRLSAMPAPAYDDVLDAPQGDLIEVGSLKFEEK